MANNSKDKFNISEDSSFDNWSPNFNNSSRKNVASSVKKNSPTRATRATTPTAPTAPTAPTRATTPTAPTRATTPNKNAIPSSGALNQPSYARGNPSARMTEPTTTNDNPNKNPLQRIGSSIISSLPLPSNIKQYARHMTRTGTEVSDKNFYPERERRWMLDRAAEADKKSGGKPKPGQQYIGTDYDNYEGTKLTKDAAKKSSDSTSSSFSGMIKRSFQDPEYAAKTSVGRFSFKSNPDSKTLDIKDTYDFKTNEGGKEINASDKKTSDLTPYGIVRKAAETLGSKEGGDVKFNIDTKELGDHPYWSKKLGIATSSDAGEIRRGRAMMNKDSSQPSSSSEPSTMAGFNEQKIFKIINKILSENKKYITEEVDLTQNVERGEIGIDNNPVKENINNLLTNALACSFVTPYIGLERVAKVLANFHFHLPKVPYLEGNHGVQVFDLNQFGELMGMKNDGTVVTKVETPYHIYFEYLMNGTGRYDVFCEIVNQEELDELLDEMEDDVNDVEDEKEERLSEQNSYMTGSGGLRNPNSSPATPMNDLQRQAVSDVQAGARQRLGDAIRNNVPLVDAGVKASQGDYAGAAKSAGVDVATGAVAGVAGKFASNMVRNAFKPASAYAASKAPYVASSALDLKDMSTKSSDTPELNIGRQELPMSGSDKVSSAKSSPEVSNMPDKPSNRNDFKLEKLTNEERLDEEGKKGTYRPGASSPRPIDIARTAMKADKALDKAYGYGTSGNISPIPGIRNKQGFGAAANYNSAKRAMNAANRTDNLRKVSNAVHVGWGETVGQLPAPDPKKQEARKKLRDTAYSELTTGEQEKDDVISRTVLNIMRRRNRKK